MHLKRMKVSTKWPMARKGNKFVVRPKGELAEGIPLLVVLRDMLKIGRNRDEIKQILNSGNVEVNGKIRKGDKLPLRTFDVIKIKSLNKIYSLAFNKAGRFVIVNKDDEKKLGKIVGKKMLKGGKVQISLNDGSNFIVSTDVKVGETAVIDTTKGKIEKFLPIKEGSKITVISGKHLGDEGKIKSIKENIAEIIIEDKNVNISLDSLMAI